MSEESRYRPINLRIMVAILLALIVGALLLPSPDMVEVPAPCPLTADTRVPTCLDAAQP